MHEVFAFLRAFPQTRDTLCSEPVLAWLARSIPAAATISASDQRALYESVGFWRATRQTLAQIGVRLAKPIDVREGEPVVVRLAGELDVFGIAGPDGATLIAGGGVLRWEMVPRLRVLRKVTA